MKAGFAKKVGAVALAAVLTLFMAPTALAQNIVIKSTSATGNVISETNGAYEGYQIFTGKVVEENGQKKFQEIKWGNGVDIVAFIQALKNDTTVIKGSETFKTAFANVAEEATDDSAKAAAVVMDKYKDDAAFAKHLAVVIGGKLTTNKITSTYDSNTKLHTLATNVAAGEGAYYFVKDAEVTPPAAAVTAFVLRVLDGGNDIVINPKADTLTSNKDVMDFNDSENGRNDDGNLTNGNTTDDSTNHDRVWKKSADHDIQGPTPKQGDRIPYRLTATMPANLDSYKTFAMKFHDNMSAGLVLDQKSIKLYVVKGDLSSNTLDYDQNASATLIPAKSNAGKVNYTVSVGAYEKYPNDPAPLPEYAGGTRLNIAFDDVKTLVDANGDAISIAAGDHVVVRYDCTFDEEKANIGSLGNKNESWVGYSRNPNGEGNGTPDVTPKETAIVFTYQYEVNKTDPEGNPLKGAEFKLEKKLADGSSITVQKLTITDETKFSFKGLDEGTYVLTETKAPDGYQPIQPFTFKVIAVHDDTTLELKELKVVNENGQPITGEVEIAVGKISGTEKPSGLMSSDVINAAPWLPTTGGIGTFLLYLVGGALIVGAGVLLFVKRRASKEA